MAVEVFDQAVAEGGSEFVGVLARYTQTWCTQLGQHAACNRLHPVGARCARWLLQTHDRVGRAELPLTQEFLASMLGVRRTSVTDVARQLQHQGLIRYQRGLIHVLDRPGLEAASCECYNVITRETDRLLGPAHTEECRTEGSGAPQRPWSGKPWREKSGRLKSQMGSQEHLTENVRLESHEQLASHMIFSENKVL